ncbi:hydrogenase expression/formation protein, partial [Haloferax sp. BAB-2207]
FRADLDAASVEPAAIDRAAGFFDDISVLPESAVLAPAATAMHDPTEGGVLNGLVELACASGVRIEVDGDDVPVRPETRALCEAMGVDPMRILGSGALLAAVPEDEADDALAALEREGIEATVVGTVESAGDGAGSNADADSTAPAAGVVYDGTHYADGVEDDMYDLWN